MVIRINNHQMATSLRNITELNSYHQDWSILYNNQEFSVYKTSFRNVNSQSCSYLWRMKIVIRNNIYYLIYET